MGSARCKKKSEPRRTFLHLAVLLCVWRGACGQVRYSIQEELPLGTIVGNVAKDMGFDSGSLAERNLRIVRGTKEELLQVNKRDGSLFVNHRIDREDLCGKTSPCYINLKAVIENPLEMHHINIEIIDINDHSPTFPDQEYHLEIPESTIPGARFLLEGAFDPDIAENTLQSYRLKKDEYFQLEVKDLGKETKMVYLVLQKSLDRERAAVHTLILTALDGGSPPKSGVLNISVTVLDANDNAPQCAQPQYTVFVKENVPAGTLLLQITASDLDEGVNGNIEYSFRNNTRSKAIDILDLDRNTGEVKVKRLMDFEENDNYEISIEVTDKGALPLKSQCNVFVKVEDVNDNAPEIDITSLSSDIPENAPLGTVVALLGVTDMDSGVNGQVVCTLPEHLPFELKPSEEGRFYSLVTKRALDRESVALYDIEITARDLGTPSLSSVKTVRVQLSDTNDNSPAFSQSPYTMYLVENNEPGAAVFAVSARDADEGENALVSYSLGNIGTGPSVTPFLSINPENGNVYALQSFDFERVKTFNFQVVAKDAGSPSLSSTVTVNVFILDQNDNAPVILSPLSVNGSSDSAEEMPRNVDAGYVVTKIKAYDPDVGYNGWLSFSLQHATDPSVFGVERYTGHIRTLRPFADTDPAQHKLVILVRDNGNVTFSATATVTVHAVESKEAFSASDVKGAVRTQEDSNVAFYLIVSLSAVSALFLITIIGLLALQCSGPREYAAKQCRDASETDTSGTLCHSIQYRSGDKRYMLVGPRMSAGSTLVPSSNRNSLVVPQQRRPTSAQVRTFKFSPFG